MRILLLSTYELGRQPFGLASPAAWLRADGHDVEAVDLSCDWLPDAKVERAELIAFYLPMHTATRLALKALEKIRGLNPRARLCAYGLYAPVNEAHLRSEGFDFIVGGEFERALADLANGIEPARTVSLDRLPFITPDRTGMAPLSRYAQLMGMGKPRKTGYTEASRGCKHLCRHCPVVPVYRGVFRIVPREVVLSDIRQQVEHGAQHVTFGDPDFFNGIGHAIPIVEALHREFPEVTYDVTIKIEHLLNHRGHLSTLQRTGCLFVTSAVESVDDAVLERLDKGHTRADFVTSLRAMRDAGLAMSPTFIPFTPWTTWHQYRDLLRTIADLDLVDCVAPIQLAIRLLIPAGSRLLEVKEFRSRLGPFDSRALSYKWQNADPSLDRLSEAIQTLIQRDSDSSRAELFRRIWVLAHDGEAPPDWHLGTRATVPYLNEPWYC